MICEEMFRYRDKFGYICWWAYQLVFVEATNGISRVTLRWRKAMPFEILDKILYIPSTI